MASTVILVFFAVIATFPGIRGASDIRLTGGITSNKGRLEVLVDGVWGTVCDFGDTFTKTEGDVACRQLQGGTGQVMDFGYFGDFINGNDSDLFLLPIAMMDVTCSLAATLQNCSFTSNPGGTCDQPAIIGLSCSNCSQYLCADGECVNGGECDGNTDCKDGSDEDKSSCKSGLSVAVIEAIVVIGFFIIIAVPVGICICICAFSGACVCCAAKSGRTDLRTATVVTTSYNPAPQKLDPVV